MTDTIQSNLSVGKIFKAEHSKSIAYSLVIGYVDGLVEQRACYGLVRKAEKLKRKDKMIIQTS